MYESRLRWWLANTTLDLFVVDSAGQCFPNLRVRCHAFNYSAAGSPLLRASISERRSILEALSAFSREFALKRLVVKLTGKYVLPGLEAALRAVPAAATAVVQTLKFPWHDDWQSTELWGMTPALLRECMAGMEASELMEQRAHRCVTDVVAAAGVGGGGGWRGDACPTARDLERTLASLRWAIWDAPCNHSSTCAALDAADGECGAARGPCCVRRRAEAASVHALPPSVRLPVYRLPPLAVPEAWRVARGDGSVLSQLPQPRTAAEPPADATKSAPSRTRSICSPARRGERRRRASRRARGRLRTTITTSFGAAVVARIWFGLSWIELLTPRHRVPALRARDHSIHTPVVASFTMM